MTERNQTVSKDEDDDGCDYDIVIEGDGCDGDDEMSSDPPPGGRLVDLVNMLAVMCRVAVL